MVNAQQLHQLDMTIAKAMGKHFTDTRLDQCFIIGGKLKPFQPTRSDADAMEVLGWLVREIGYLDVSRWLNGFSISNGQHHVLETWEDAQAETLPLAISLFAERVINEK